MLVPTEIHASKLSYCLTLQQVARVKLWQRIEYLVANRLVGSHLIGVLDVNCFGKNNNNRFVNNWFVKKSTWFTAWCKAWPYLSSSSLWQTCACHIHQEADLLQVLQRIIGQWFIVLLPCFNTVSSIGIAKRTHESLFCTKSTLKRVLL